MPGFGDAFSAWGSALKGGDDKQGKDSSPQKANQFSLPGANPAEGTQNAEAGGGAGALASTATPAAGLDFPTFMAALSDSRAKRNIKASPRLEEILGKLKQYRSKSNG